MRDPGNFDAFYLATAHRVVHHVYAVYGNLADAQEVAQEAYARAWQRWSTVSAYEDPEGWVRLVAWRLAANRWRGLYRWIRARARLGAPAPVPAPSPDRVAVLAALRRIPPAQRRVVVLHYLCGMSVADIVASTGMPAGTIKVYLARGRAALAALLNDGETPPPARGGRPSPLTGPGAPVNPPATPVDRSSAPVDPPATPVNPPATPVDPPATPVDPPATAVRNGMTGGRRTAQRQPSTARHGAGNSRPGNKGRADAVAHR